MCDFIGRKKELELIAKTTSNKTSTITIIYGRRRVGKSELIRQSVKNNSVLFFEGLENQSKSNQIQNFITQLKYQTKSDEPIATFKHWREAFMQLLPHCRNKTIYLVFDEFQWMANYRSEIVSDLKMVWDQYLSRTGIVHLILCGSIASFMLKKVLASKALYGRNDLTIHLKPFSLKETMSMLNNRSFNEILEAQMLVGGIPKYLNLIRSHSSIQTAMQELAFTDHGYFVTEYERIFTSHFGSNPDFKKIIATLAKHPYGITRHKLSQSANINTGGGLSNMLEDLSLAGFVESYVPFDRKINSRQIIYCLKDPYLMFYFSFILPQLKDIKAQTPDLFYALTQSQEYASWLGRAFEYVCMDHARIISSILGFSGIRFSTGPYFQNNKNAKMQIDLVFDRADHVLVLCEIKHTQRPPGIELINETERKVTLIETKTKKTIHKILITKTKPTTSLINRGYFYKIIMADELVK